MSAQLLKHRFTVEDYHRMAEAGILGEDDRVELIEGEIVEMSPIGRLHAACVARLTALFSRVQERAIVWVQNPVHLGEHSEPEPDVALLRPRPDFYASGHPGSDDVLLIVEVAETSAQTDRDVKLPLYARAGIPEVWLVDLERGTIEIHREPRGEEFKTVRRLGSGEPLSPKAIPDLELIPENVLG